MKKNLNHLLEKFLKMLEAKIYLDNTRRKFADQTFQTLNEWYERRLNILSSIATWKERSGKNYIT